MVRQVRRWLPEGPLSSWPTVRFAALDFVDATRPNAIIITRLRLDAALYAPAPVRHPGQRGRSRKKGARLFALSKVLADAYTQWTSLTARFCYGEQNCVLQVTSETALWYYSGAPVITLRWVLVRDPLGQFETQALLCTDVHATPAFIFDCFVQRWQMEVTFEKARAIRAWKPNVNGRTRRLPVLRLPC